MATRAFNPGSWALALRLARRELRGGLRGFGVFLACLVLGVTAIAGVRTTAASLLDGLGSDGRRLLGGDIAVERELEPPTAKQRQALQAKASRIAEFAELRSMARVPEAAERSSLVEVKAVGPNYPLYGAVKLASGAALADALAKRDGRWGAVVAPELLTRLGLSPGDRLAVGEAVFDIRARLVNEPDRVSGGGFLIGPRVMIARKALPATGLIQRGTQVDYNYRLKVAPGTDAVALAERLEELRQGGEWEVRPYTDAAPGLSEFIERLTLFLTLIGLAALLVGGVGVSNAVRAFLDGKLRVIATLKTLGAPARLVFRLYLLQIVALALVAIAVGLVLGAALPPIALSAFSGVLPIDAQLGIYPAALAVAAASGLLVAVTFAIWPLARARELPAAALFRSAIAAPAGRPRAVYWLAVLAGGAALAALAVLTARDREFALWFVGGAAATLVLFRLAGAAVTALAARVPRPKQPALRLALANLHRPGAPTGAVVLSLGLGLSVLTGIALIEGNMGRQIREQIPASAPAFFFIDIQGDQKAGFLDTVAAVEGAEPRRVVPIIQARVTQLRGLDPKQARQGHEQAWFTEGDRRVTYRADKPADTRLVAGSWWDGAGGEKPLVSVESEVARAHGLTVGDTLTVRVAGRPITAEIANLRKVDWADVSLNFALIFSPNALQGAPQTYVATVAVPPAQERNLQGAVVERFPNVTAVRVREALETANNLLAKLGTAVRSVAALTLVAGTLVLGGAIASGHERRVYDAVVLKVLGATRRRVLGALSLEYGLLGLVTAALAVGVGALVSWGVMRFVFSLSWTFLPGVAIATVVGCALATFALGLVGTWRALSRPAAPLLRNE